jgi:hypothetical protein
MALGKTAKYYRENPEARKKHQETSKKAAAKPEAIKRRIECNKARKELGLKKGDTRDASHTKSGKLVAEARSTNRARNGHGNNGRLK